MGRDWNLTHVFPVACYIWGPGEGLVVSLRGEMLTGPGGRTSAQPSALSTDFVPIDLDEWWAQQFLARITNCS